MTLARRLAPVLLLVIPLGACTSLFKRDHPGGPPPPPPQGSAAEEEAALAVKKVDEEIIVAAWAEPAKLPEGGGQAQILVRVQKHGGARFPGVEVRLRANAGSLFSAGRVLVTDAQGMTRDRLTTRKTVTITLNAGGTRYRFQVPVAERPPEQD
jgi:hypothetical protein